MYESVYGIDNVCWEDSKLCNGSWEELQRICLKCPTGGVGFLKEINFKSCSKLKVLKIVDVNVENDLLDLSTPKLLRSVDLVKSFSMLDIVKEFDVCGLRPITNFVVLRWNQTLFNSSCINEIKYLTNLQVLHLLHYNMDSFENKFKPLWQTNKLLKLLKTLTKLQDVYLDCNSVFMTLNLSSNYTYLRCFNLSGCLSLQFYPGLDKL